MTSMHYCLKINGNIMRIQEIFCYLPWRQVRLKLRGLGQEYDSVPRGLIIIIIIIIIIIMIIIQTFL